MSQKVMHCTGRGVDAIVGVSKWARSIRAEIVRVARHDSSVLITGPSGTGKELIARAICAHGLSRNAPLVPVDCAALPVDLFASQLFGHKKGAFTGAHCSTMGAFRAANGGTIFFDEIGEMDHLVQAKLLRVIQERTVVPLGSHQGEAVDVRIIAATNRNLEEEVRAGRFREDLYYRLNVISLKTLPLVDRVEDIEYLANHILHRLVIDAGLPLRRLAEDTLRLLQAYPWPGNVRELNNHLERAVVCSSSDILGPETIPELVEYLAENGPAPQQIRQEIPAQPCDGDASDDNSERHVPHAAGRPDWPTIAEIERRHILDTLEEVFFNQCAAAKMLGIDRHALHRKIIKYGLDNASTRRGRPPMHLCKNHRKKSR